MAVFPSSPEPTYPLKIEPSFKTLITDFESGKESRRQRWAFPKRLLILQFETLTQTEVDILYDFFLARKGSFNPFYYFWPLKDENGDWPSYDGEYVYRGNGTQTLFDLPGKNISSSSLAVSIDGVVITPVTFSQGTGPDGVDQITFNATGNITSSSVANPTVITTTAAHGLTTGSKVLIAGHTGSTPAISGTYTVTVSINFNALSQTSRAWKGMAAAPNGNIYACVANGDIYMQTGGTGNFNALSQTIRSWWCMAAAPNGNVYAAVLDSDIYMQTGGTGNFNALGQTGRSWRGMAAAPNGNVYACNHSGDIYMQTGGTGNFNALGQTVRAWRGMAAAPNGNIYASVENGDIYMQTNGAGDFIALNQTSRAWQGMAAAPNGNIYACVYNSDIYMQTNGTGNFNALNQTSRTWYNMAAAPNGNVYISVYGGDIYMQGNATFTIPVNVTVGGTGGTWTIAVPSNGSIITADFQGQLRYRMRFKSDNLSKELFTYVLYSIGMELYEVRA